MTEPAPARSEPGGFECVFDAPPAFPLACAKCGASTTLQMAVNVSMGRPEFLKGFVVGMFGGHLGHLVHAVQVLKGGSVRIPCCASCRRPYYIGNVAAFLCLVVAAIGFYFSVNSNLPLWALYLTVIPSTVLLFLWVIPHAIGKTRALPATVWLEDDGYHYLFVTGAYRNVMTATIPGSSALPPAPPSLPTQ